MKKDLTGTKIGLLTALKFDRFENRKTYWLYQCDCGNQKIIRADQVTEKDTKSCGCHKKKLDEQLRIEKTKDPGIGMSTRLYHKYRGRAKQRGYSFELSIDQFRELTSDTCKYCGIEPSQTTERSTYNGAYIYNGIDRVDNAVGYIISNCRTCCKTCNMAKHTMTEESFLAWIERITKYNAGKH